jgi:hypothetical protein
VEKHAASPPPYIHSYEQLGVLFRLRLSAGMPMALQSLSLDRATINAFFIVSASSLQTERL